MAKDWAKLAGEKGKKVEKGRFRRALKLGGLATRVTGSMIKAQIGKISGRSSDDNLDSMANAAMENAQRIVDVMGQMKGAAMKKLRLLAHRQTETRIMIGVIGLQFVLTWVEVQ